VVGGGRSEGQGRPATSGHLPAAALSDCGPYCFKFFSFLVFFGKYGEWAKPFWRIGVQHPHFLKLAPTLGSVKCFILHGDWRFHFFSNFIFSKFRVHLDLHIYCWDFGFMKN
jgi:hypothetical protein